jgi:hypothetical protein
MRGVAVVVILSLGMSTGLLAAGEPQNGQGMAPLHQSIAREALRMARQSAGAGATQASERSWAGRHPVALGMLLGLSGGMAVGAAQHYEGKRAFGPFMALGGGIGIGIGAGVGAIVSAATR